MLAFFVFPYIVSAANEGANKALQGLNQTAGQGFANNPSADLKTAGVITDIPSAVGRIVGSVLAFIGVVFFVLMIYGGFVWMFSRGNTQDVQKAKDIIEASIIGLIIVMAAYAITAYVGTTLTTVS